MTRTVVNTADDDRNFIAFVKKREFNWWLRKGCFEEEGLVIGMEEKVLLVGLYKGEFVG